ncbi:hypothetical protein BJX70DRAFT_401532 [Aspergillus crustosus]
MAGLPSYSQNTHSHQPYDTELLPYTPMRNEIAIALHDLPTGIRQQFPPIQEDLTHIVAPIPAAQGCQCPYRCPCHQSQPAHRSPGQDIESPALDPPSYDSTVIDSLASETPPPPDDPPRAKKYSFNAFGAILAVFQFLCVLGDIIGPIVCDYVKPTTYTNHYTDTLGNNYTRVETQQGDVVHTEVIYGDAEIGQWGGFAGVDLGRVLGGGVVAGLVLMGI